MPERVLLREWITIFLLGGAILALGAIAFLSRERGAQKFFSERRAFVEKDFLRVTVVGAVDKPGEYQVPRGTTLKDLFQLVPLAENANRRALRMKQVLDEDQTIEVPAKKGKARPSPKRSPTAQSTAL